MFAIGDEISITVDYSERYAGSIPPGLYLVRYVGDFRLFQARISAAFTASQLRWSAAL